MTWIIIGSCIYVLAGLFMWLIFKGGDTKGYDGWFTRGRWDKEYTAWKEHDKWQSEKCDDVSNDDYENQQRGEIQINE